MEIGEHCADARAIAGSGLLGALTVEPFPSAGRPSSVCSVRPCLSGMGARSGSRALQPAHQVDEVRHLVGFPLLDQGQHILPALAGHEVVGVLYALTDAFERQQLADVEPVRNASKCGD